MQCEERLEVEVMRWMVGGRGLLAIQSKAPISNLNRILYVIRMVGSTNPPPSFFSFLLADITEQS